MERFYNTMKTEFVYQYSFETDEDLNQGIHEYIFDWYNYSHSHSYNDGKTPFEMRHSNELSVLQFCLTRTGSCLESDSFKLICNSTSTGKAHIKT